jgi:hypothetical protein
VFTFYSVLQLTCDQEVLADLQEITKQVAAQAALDRLWLELKIPAPVPNKQSKKRRHQKSPLIWSSPASTSSRRNDCWDGWNETFVACTPLASPARSNYATPSDLSSDCGGDGE